MWRRIKCSYSVGAEETSSFTLEPHPILGHEWEDQNGSRNRALYGDYTPTYIAYRGGELHHHHHNPLPLRVERLIFHFLFYNRRLIKKIRHKILPKRKHNNRTCWVYWVKSHSGHLYFIYSTLVVRYQRGNLLCVLCLYIKSVISWLYFRPFLNLWLANDLMTRLLVTVNSFVIILRKKMSINGWFLYDYAFFMLRISISKTCNVSKTGFDHDFMNEILWCIYSLNGSSVMVFVASFACF